MLYGLDVGGDLIKFGLAGPFKQRTCLLRLLGIFLFLGLAGYRQSQGDEATESTTPGIKKDAQVSSHIKTFQITNTGTTMDMIDFGEVPYGNKLDALIALENHLDESISFEQVKPSCACVNVELPKVTLEKGQSELLRVTYMIEDKRSLNFSHALEILCSGGVQKILLIAQAKPVNMAVFHTAETTFIIPDEAALTDETGDFYVPLLVSNVEALEGIRFQSAAESPFKNLKLVREQDKGKLQAVIDYRQIKDANAQGTIELVSEKYDYRDKLVYRIVREMRVSVHPEKVVMRSDGQHFSGSCLVRTRPKLVKAGAEKQSDAESQAEEIMQVRPDEYREGDLRFEVQFHSITKNVGRLQFTVNPAGQPIEKEIPAEVLVELGDHSLVRVPFLFSF